MANLNLTVYKSQENSRTISYEGRNLAGVFVAINIDKVKGESYPVELNVAVANLAKASGA